MKKILLLMLLAVTFVWADIAPNPIFGGLTLTAKATNECDIILVSEAVTLTVNSNNTVDVRAEFFLRNTGATTNITVGFPHSYTNDFLSFSASVGASPVSCRTDKVVVQHPPWEDLFGNKTIIQDHPDNIRETTYWEVWDMKFKTAEEVHVVVNYRTKLWVSHEYITSEFFSSWYVGKKREDLLKKTQRGELEYILTTGSHWKGPIGKATICVDLSAFPSSTVERVYPNGAIIRENEVVWEMNDFEPNANIAFSFYTSGPFNKLKLLQSLYEQYPDDWHIADELTDELQNEKYRLYEKLVMSSELSNYTLSYNLRDELTREEKDKIQRESVYAQTILSMAMALVRAYDRYDDFDGLRRIAPKVLPMLNKFKQSFEEEGGRWRDSWLEDISSAIPICERIVQPAETIK